MRISALRPITSEVKTYDFVALDTEGTGRAGGFICASTYDASGAHLFKTPRSLERYLFARRHEGKRIVAANLEYDYAVAFQPFSGRFSIMLANGRWIRATYTDDSGHTHTAWDIQRIAPLSVAQMGDIIGLPKYPTPRGLALKPDDLGAHFTCDLHRRTDCVECYCMRDSEIVYRFALLYQRTLNDLGGEMKMTAASCSLDLWRRRFLSDEIAPTFEEKNRDARRAYYGGRVENYRAGTARDINIYDVNSLYPAAMCDLEVGLPHTYHHLSQTNRLSARLDRFGMWAGTIDVPRSYVPLLPVRQGLKVFYPVGRLTGAWVNSEVRFALDHGARIVRTDSITFADQTIKPFARFVKTLWGLRSEYKRAGDAREHVVKILLNSLYGKFGQHSDKGLETLTVPRRGFALSTYDGCTPIDLCGYQAFLRPIAPDIQAPHAHVLWAAEIAAHARIKLYDLLGDVAGDLYYCDTDSVHTKRRLVEGQGLGDLKLEDEYDKITYFAPKEYGGVKRSGDFESKAKGVPRSMAGEYLARGLVEFSKPNHTLEAIATRGRIAEWHTVTKHKLYSTPCRDYPIPDDYNLPAVDSKPFDASALSDLA